MSNKIIGIKDIETILKSENTKDIERLYKIYIDLDDKNKSLFMEKFISANHRTNNMYKYVSKSIYFTNLILKYNSKDENLYRLLKLIEYQCQNCRRKEQYNVKDWFRDNIIVENHKKLKEIKINTNRPINERKSIAQLFLNITFRPQNSKYINKEIKKEVIKFIEKSLLIDIKNIDLVQKVINITEINEILQLNKIESYKRTNKNKRDIDKDNSQESNENKRDIGKDNSQESNKNKRDIDKDNSQESNENKRDIDKDNSQESNKNKRDIDKDNSQEGNENKIFKDKDNNQKNAIKKEEINIVTTEIKINNIEELKSKPKLNQIKYMFNDVCTYIEDIEKQNKLKEEDIKKYEIRCENEKKINDSLNGILKTKDEEINKLKLDIDRLNSRLKYIEIEKKDILSNINLLNSEKEKIEKELNNKNIEIEELKQKSIKLANINTKEANNEFTAYKNRLASKLKLYYSEFKEAKDRIHNESDKAQFLQDQLEDIFKILISNDIKLK